VQHAQLDVNEDTAIDGAVDAAWTALGEVDVVLMAHGTLPDQLACDSSRHIAIREFSTNATATIGLIIPIAARMEASGRGTIAVISSVAGDRGRASNYLYGAAKAATSTYLSGLRQRLNGKGVNVLTIKPGFVDTPMTASFRKGALWASPSQVAQNIVTAIARRKSVAYTPAFWALIMWVIRSIPEFVFRRIKL
jgi:short-subunit dehydrogenase